MLRDRQRHLIRGCFRPFGFEAEIPFPRGAPGGSRDLLAIDRELEDAVDFVTIHILPYWENIPIRAKFAAAQADAIRQRMVSAFPGKEILLKQKAGGVKERLRIEGIKLAESAVITGIAEGAGQAVMTWTPRETVGVEVPPNKPGLAVIKRVSASTSH